MCREVLFAHGGSAAAPVLAVLVKCEVGLKCCEPGVQPVMHPAAPRASSVLRAGVAVAYWCADQHEQQHCNSLATGYRLWLDPQKTPSIQCLLSLSSQRKNMIVGLNSSTSVSYDCGLSVVNAAEIALVSPGNSHSSRSQGNHPVHAPHTLQQAVDCTQQKALRPKRRQSWAVQGSCSSAPR